MQQGDGSEAGSVVVTTKEPGLKVNLIFNMGGGSGCSSRHRNNSLTDTRHSVICEGGREWRTLRVMTKVRKVLGDCQDAGETTQATTTSLSNVEAGRKARTCTCPTPL